MKRHLTPEGSDESRSKSRRILDSRITGEEEEPGGFLDLNTTPRGFDLNAPIAEDDSSHGQSGWLPAQDNLEDKGKTSEPKLSVIEEVSQPKASIKNENDARASKSEDSESLIVPSEAGGQERETQDERIDLKEATDEPDLKATTLPTPKPPVPAAIVIQRTLEPASTLGIDDDLDILGSVWSAHQQNDVEGLDSVVLDACEELSKNPFNPSRYHYLSCLFVSKKLPEVFGLPKTFKAVLGFLRSPSGGQPNLKRQIMLPLLASKLLLRAFATELEWPLDFVQVYLEDATVSRSWIEHEGCKEFVANILTAFPEVDVELSASTEDSIPARAQDSQGGSGEIVQGQAVKSEAAKPEIPLKNRYPAEEVRAKVRTEFLQALNQLLGSASTKDNPRQLLKLLMQGAGYEEVRVVASSMLEGYLNNPVHLRAAKALLDRILQHTRGTSDNDLNTVANLLALRITSMQPSVQTKSLHGNIFGDMVAQLVRRRPEYTTLALKTFVTAEVNNRNPHNLKSIVMVLKAMPESPPPEYELALILQELAASDDYRLQLRDLVRRMMKQVGPEIDVHALCHGLMQPWPAMGEQHETLKEAWLKQLVDLSCQLLLLATVPFALDENVVSAITSSSGSSVSAASNPSLKEKLLQLEKFSLDTASFQVEAVAWCTDVLAIYLPSMDENQFTRFVRQILFLESSEVYFNTTENTSEVDLVSLRLLSSCLSAPEEILARLILMAISNYPVSQGEALKLIERLVWRAAALKKHVDGALTAASVQLPAAIFKLASFNLPGVTRQPVAQLVVKDMYWRACLVVLIIAAYNASTIGWFVWENLPTIRCLMEALLTCTRTFIPIGADEVRLSEVNKLELEAEQRDSKAEEAISAFLDVAEKRRNDSSSLDMDSRGTLMSSPGSRLASQSGEWKGKVMFLNQTGPVRRPPKSMIDELDKVDATYQLGNFLRKSRSPDFFAEITKQQNLPQAWPWLQKILVQAPEVITYLPPVWQGELLFMHEGKHALIRKLPLDIGKLRVHLCQVMVQQVQSKEGDIESVVDFLSHKLVSKSGTVRGQARRCFSCLFDVPPSSAPDFNISVPSSPQESKRVDLPGGAAGGVVPLVKGVLNPVSTDNVLGSSKKVVGVPAVTPPSSIMSASAVQVTSTSLSSLSGGALRASPGVSHLSVTKDGVPDRTASSAQVPIARDDCRWLEILEKLVTASRVITVLAPAIQRAMQQENSIYVVKAYMKFLNKHLSETSLACCIASFVAHRNMVASSLLLGPTSGFVPGEDPIDSGLSSRAVTIDLVLESLCKALKSGTTVNDLNWDERALVQSPVVKLISPYLAGNTNELNFMHVRIHKIVVDAALEVLSLLGQEDTEDKRKNLGFHQLLNLLFPDFDNVDHAWKWDVNVPMVWLEDGGEKRPLLSEPQAVRFVRTKNARLVKAGLSVLSLESKLELCESFGLSSVGAEALFADLNPVKDTRLEMILGSGSFTGQHLKKLSSCVSTIVKGGNNCGVNLLRMLEQLATTYSVDHSQNLLLSVSGHERSEPSSIELSEAPNLPELMNQSLEEIASNSFEWLTSKGKKEVYTDMNFEGKPMHYVQFRKYLQTLLIGGWDARINNCLEAIFRILRKAEGDSLADLQFLSFGLPILSLVSQHAPIVERSSPEGPVSTPRYTSVHFKSDERIISVENLFDVGLQNKWVEDSKVSGIFTSASVLLRTLQRQLANVCGKTITKCNNDGSHIRHAAHAVALRMRDSENFLEREAQEDQLSGENVAFSVVEHASVDRFESLLRYFLSQKLQFLWREIREPREISHSGSLPISVLSKHLVDLLARWTWRGDLLVKSFISPPCEMSTLIHVRDQVEYSGRCGLVMEMLELLDPEFQWDGLLKSVVAMSQLHAESKLLSGSCILPVTLSSVVHKSSWKTLSKVSHVLLETDLDEGSSHSHKNGLWYDGNYCHTSGATSQSLEGVEAVMEFISLWLQHPRTKLACRLSDEKSSSKLSWSWLDPSSARTLTKHAVSACVSAKLENDAEGMNVRSSNVWIQQYVHELQRNAVSPQSRSLKVLLLAASQGSHIMGAIVQQLSSYEESLGDEFTHTVMKRPAATAFKTVAQSFLQGLYLAFPVTIKALLHAWDREFLLKEERRSLNDVQSIRGQTCSLNTVVHSALRSVCNGNEKDSNAAYGFCQEFSRQHPLLVLPHLPTLRLLMKELLPLLKQGEAQGCATAIRALSLGLGLLDALRPHVILINNSNHKISDASCASDHAPVDKSGASVLKSKESDYTKQKTDLEAIFDLYFQILRGLDVQDRAPLAKLVARFSDFLCHCVAAGGRSREYVAQHRTPILETTAQAFGKLKKIGFLLSLLDKPEVIPHADETSVSGTVISRPLSSAAYSQGAPSSVAHDDILKVRAQLQQCIKLHTGDSWQEQGLAFYSKGKALKVCHMGGNLERGSLSTTLNDLERASARMPAILTILEDSLVQLTMVKDAPVREQIYNLLERSLLHCPSEESVSNIVQGLLQQLRSSDVLRAKSAARNAARFFHFSPELQESILVEMLQLGRIASDDLQQLLQSLFSVAGCPNA